MELGLVSNVLACYNCIILLSDYELMTAMMMMVMVMVLMEVMEVGLIDVLARNNCIRRPTNANNWMWMNWPIFDTD